jgi:hypothetical protein
MTIAVADVTGFGGFFAQYHCVLRFLITLTVLVRLRALLVLLSLIRLQGL